MTMVVEQNRGVNCRVGCSMYTDGRKFSREGAINIGKFCFSCFGEWIPKFL